MDDTRRDEIWFAHAGTRLHAVAGGHGVPIVLLHGGLASHQACWLFAGALAARFRLITPDLRASGRSRYAGALSWDLLADDVVALLDHLGIERAVIGGTSFGAGCAVRVALRHPARVSALAVLHPVFAGEDAGLAPAAAAAMRAIDAAGRRVLAEGIEALFPLFDALPDAIRARARALVASYDPASVATTTRFMASGTQPFARASELAAIAVPTLVVPGLDPEHPVEVAEVYRRHLPRCTVRAVAASELADAIAELVERELASVGPGLMWAGCGTHP